MPETWRLVDVEFRDDPFMNLAIEEAIPRTVGFGKVPNTVRFWHNSNTIVLGCFQSASLEVNFEACKELGTDVVARSSFDPNGRLAACIPKAFRGNCARSPQSGR